MESIDLLEYSFVVELGNGEETEICSCKKRICPRKGEYIWMPYDWKRKEEFGTRSFIVEDVCHHMNDNEKWTGSYDSIIVYCKPIALYDNGN